MCTVGRKGIGYSREGGFVMERKPEAGLYSAAHILFLDLAARFTVVFAS